MAITLYNVLCPVVPKPFPCHKGVTSFGPLTPNAIFTDSPNLNHPNPTLNVEYWFLDQTNSADDLVAWHFGCPHPPPCDIWWHCRDLHSSPPYRVSRIIWMAPNLVASFLIFFFRPFLIQTSPHHLFAFRLSSSSSACGYTQLFKEREKIFL